MCYICLNVFYMSAVYENCSRITYYGTNGHFNVSSRQQFLILTKC